MDASTVDVAVWNIEADGGRNGERRDFALDILAALKPDVVLQQEAKHSRERGGRLLHSAEKRLSLRGFLSAPNPDVDADIATAVYLRPDMFHIAEQKPRAKPWWLHPCHVQTQLGDCPVPLNFVSLHMCFFDPAQRLTEARWLTTLAQDGMATIAAGDTNSYPRRSEQIALPNWETVTDRAHMVHRTYVDSQGGRHSDTRPDGALIDGEGPFPTPKPLPTHYRHLTHVDDIAEGTLRALTSPRAHNETINIGSGTVTSIRDVAVLVRGHFPKAEFLATRLPAGDPLGGYASIRRMEAVLSWTPAVTVAEGVERYVQWLRRTPQAAPSWLTETAPS